MRFQAIKQAQRRSVVHAKSSETSIPKLFASNVFNETAMKDYLSKEAFVAVTAAIRDGIAINRDMAAHIAAGMKRWALAKGASHYTHWFQPLTGATAEKHDSFYDGVDGEAIEKFSADNLVQQEPDASSLPSGGLRNTFEARGYTAWDPTSPAFIYENSTGSTLCIPTVFVSYNGEALDYKTPLLKSLNFLDKQATAVCKYFDDAVTSCNASLGIEQEYFLIDEALFNVRPDLLLCGRTLLGHAPAKGQQMEDHYFGSIPDRVFNYMYDMEMEALKLGIPLKTRHNEVAPGQYECAPLFEKVNLAIDHNQLLMDLMDEIAKRHGFRVLFHEKPFAGVNGSGKHNNWSLITNTGVNLLSPGSNPNANLQFLTFFINTIKAVHDSADILRASIASAANDHRLGANEAPPAIISVFVGSTLTEVLDDFASGKEDINGKSGRTISIENIPEILADNTDRNRTSPFAFTGNKFELRAVGSSKNSAQPMTALNSAVANQLKNFRTAVDALIAQGKDEKAAVVEELKNVLRDSRNILFEGNNYGDEWVVEAEKRGLKNIKNTPESLDAYISKTAIDVFVKNKIFTEPELHARHDIMLEEYVKKIQIEGRVLDELFYGLNPGSSQLELISEITEHVDEAKKLVDKMTDARRSANRITDAHEKAIRYHEDVKESFDKIRYHVDKLEMLVDDNLWKLPKYREMLFIR